MYVCCPEKESHPGERLVVLGHAGEKEVLRALRVRKFVKARLGQRAAHLPGAVGAEVEEDDGVVIADRSNRLSASRHARPLIYHNDRLDELIGHAAVIACAHRGNRIHHPLRGISVNHRTIGALDALPAVIAIHGVVAARDAGDRAHVVFGKRVLQLIEKLGAAVWRRVAPVHETVHENPLNLLFASQLQESEEMVNVRMHATVAQQSNQVELFFAATRHCFDQQRIAKEFTVADHQVEPRAIHLNDAPRADIEMAHFAVAHLSIGQAHPFAGSVDQSVREALQEVVIIRLASKGDGIALRFGAKAPAVKDGQYNWSRALRHIASGYTEGWRE